MHTNCLAALANMSGQFKNLHPYVSQRLVSMFEALAKKYFRLMAVLDQSGSVDSEGHCSIGKVATCGFSTAVLTCLFSRVSGFCNAT